MIGQRSRVDRDDDLYGPTTLRRLVRQVRAKKEGGWEWESAGLGAIRPLFMRGVTEGGRGMDLAKCQRL